MDLLGDHENISLIEDDYVIVDQITESYRQLQRLREVTHQKRSFCEENLIASQSQNTPF